MQSNALIPTVLSHFSLGYKISKKCFPISVDVVELEQVELSQHA